MDLQNNIDYWENEIKKIEETCDLTVLLKQQNKNKVVLHQYDHVKQPKSNTLLITGNLYHSLKRTCRQNGFTLSSILQFVWHKVLSIYGNSNQTVTGTIVSGRNLPINNIESSVGLFINTLPLIVTHDAYNLIIDAIKNIQDHMNEMISRSNVNFSQLSKGTMKHTLFDSLFVYENYPTLEKQVVQMEKLLQFQQKYTIEKVDYPLAVLVYETVESECITFILNYAGELFESEIIDDLLGIVHHLLDQIGFQQITQISDLCLLPKNQLNVINEWNKTDHDFPELNKRTTLHKLFEEEVEKSSEKIAVVYGDVQLTYQHLNQKANQLAHYLRSICDIHPDDLIALFLDKSELMIMSILGVWKSGAAYVPIDPNYPDERIQFIIEDTKAKIVITNQKYMTKLHSYDLVKVPIDSPLMNQFINMHSMLSNIDSNTNEHDLAYVIYTSGTTGKPKGVLVEHHCMVSLRNDIKHRYFGSNDTNSSHQAVLFLSNYMFDVSIEQIVLSILSSNMLIIPENTLTIDETFYSYLNNHRLTYLSGTPTQVHQINLRELKYLKTVTVAGEMFVEDLFQKFRTETNARIINAYGPTETAIYNTVYMYENDMKYRNSIGIPLSNTKTFVLNNNMQMMPIYAIGELYLTGDCVARGYLNRSELTASRFLANPFQTDEEKKEGKNARIYKTGDLVRRLPNGELEYLGRNDFQVKIRGLRIELGEIEAVLSSYEGVKQSVVIARDGKTVDGEGGTRKYLLGYFISEDALLESNIKEYMETKLPSYMIPNRLMRIDKIPVNRNGKLDSGALPEVDFINKDQINVIRARNDVEAKIVDVWSQLLHIPVESIDIHNDFFSLGGDSISVVKLSVMLSKCLSLKLDIGAIFKNKTIAKLASYILRGVHGTIFGQNKAILKMDRNHAMHSNYRLSFAQERLFFINEFDGEYGSSAYNIIICRQFSNMNVRRDSLRQSLFAILDRHEILRTLVRDDKSNGFYQHLLNEEEARSLFEINEVRVANEEELDAKLSELAKYVFNLRKELPLKITFYEMQNDDGCSFTTLYMCILMHHICFDGWSEEIFWRELQIFYDYFEKQVNDPSSDSSSCMLFNLPVLPVQYKDFAVWQREYLSGEIFENLSEFWKKKLDNFEMLNLIPDCLVRPPKYDYSGDEIMFELNEQITIRLKQLAKDLNVTLFSLLLSAYALMLGNYTNQQDIVIGTPVANRNQPELENLIGFFVNILVLRIKIDVHGYVVDYIKEVSNEVINAQIHQEMPFERLVKQLSIENDTSRHPIVQVIFMIGNQFAQLDTSNANTIETAKSLQMLQYIPKRHNFTPAKYDISTSIDETNVCLKGNFNFATKLFNRNTIETFIRTFIHILTQFSKIHSTSTMQDISCLTTEEQNQITKWSKTDRDFPELNKRTTLHKLFEEEVEKSSDKIAVVYGDVQLTYQHLNQKANQLAHYLRSICDIHPDDLIALFLDKSELMIMSILGVWKSGAAYVPIDPNYPDERIQFIIEDTKAKIFITNQKYMTKLHSYDLVKVPIDSPLMNQFINMHSMLSNIGSNTNEHDLAYVIYTSGTTGKPKGVLVEHHCVVVLRNDIKHRYFGSNDTNSSHQAVLFLSNYIFDFSIEQIVLSILSSNMLIIPENTLTIDEKFYCYLNNHRLTYLSGTPTQVHQINLRELKYLKTVTVAGEMFVEDLFQKFRTETNARIINAYGLTETAVYNMVYIYENDMKYRNSIGIPLSNTKTFVLNNNMQMMPIYAIGELYLTGDCVARGYLNRSELTASRFLANPFQTDEEKKEGKNARIYKTGDLVRWLPNGELEYLGRNDFQVKIRGLRIELGEIEAVLSSYEGVKQSVVIARDGKTVDGEGGTRKYLLGYFISEDALLESNIKEYMETKLPSYMIPNRLIRIDKIPMNRNGKLDTKALPNMDFDIDGGNYCAPRNELEAWLCEIWSEVLGIDNIGIKDDFFQLGGDSVGTLQIIGRVRQTYGLNLSVKDIFMWKTIEKLYDNKLQFQVIQSNDSNQSLHAMEFTNSNMSNSWNSLSPIQEYWLKQKDFSRNHFHQCIAFRITQFDENKFRDCIAKLVAHHEVFRMRLKQNLEGQYSLYCQTNFDSEEIHLLNVGNSLLIDLNVETVLKNILIMEENMKNEPMYMVAYSYDHKDNTSARVWIFMHDLIIDWISCHIISADLQRLYVGSNMTSDNYYKHWSNAVKTYVNNIGADETAYWHKLLNTGVNISNKTLANKLQTSHEISETEIILTEEIITYLLNDCNKIYNTQIEHILLTGLAYALRDEITNAKENYVMFECCGRDFTKDLDMHRSVGMFRTMYPVLLQLASTVNDDDNDNNVRSSIINIKEQIKQVPNKGIGFGAIIHSENINFPWISFNYLGLFEKENNTNIDENRWYLLDDDVYKNTMDKNTQELIKISAFIINKHLRLNVKTKIGIERTVQFGKSLQFNIEKIIKHTQLVNRSYLTISDINYVIKNQDYLNKIQLEKEVDVIFLANSLQQGLLYHSLKQNDVDDAYIVQSVFQYRTNIDQNLFHLAWKHAQKKFSCLRLRFAWQEEIIQIIDKAQTLDWRFIDLSEEVDLVNQESKIKQIQEADRNERFKLDAGNLLRVYLIEQKSDLFALIFSCHHIILDGWSLPILFNFVHQHYLDLIEDRHRHLPISSSSTGSFRDETYENAQMYIQKHRDDNIDYWENEIKKIEETCDLTVLLKQQNKNKVVLYQYDHVKQPKSNTLLITGNLYHSLKRTCRQNGFTLSSILQFVWHKVLSIYGNSNQTVTGTIVSGRNLPINNIESSVGLFINTLPLIVTHDAYNLIIDAIKNIQDHMNEMISRSNVNFSQLSKGTMKHTLFDSLFVYENYPTLEKQVVQMEKLLQFQQKYTIEKVDYPLAVLVYETVESECITFILNYAGELFESEIIDDLLGIVHHLLDQIGFQQITQISDLCLLPKNQLNVINEWNKTDHDFPELNKRTTLHKLFEEEVEKSSDKIAVVYGDVQLTYRHLNQKANQLAHYLRSICDIHPDDLIALFLDKSELMIMSILGVWKSGAAYVPIDPNYPDERIQFIIEDTKAKIVITNQKYMTKLHSYDLVKVPIDSPLMNQCINMHSMLSNIDSNTNEHDLAYVIYTSGTTGKPKGVLVEHHCVVVLRNDIKHRYFGSNDTNSSHQAVLFLSNYIFDFSIEQIVLSILSSNMLIIPENTLTIDEKFYCYLNNHRLTYISATPSLVNQFNLRELKYLEMITIGGEMFPENLFQKFRTETNARINNGYGVTETGICNMVCIYENDMKYRNSIGIPLSNTKTFVLNNNMQMMPIYAIGELYLTGDCVARGYLNRSELTASRFLANPFQTDEEKKEGKNARIYKTGDLVRRLPNGELEYLGRNDFQVKIRGLRIELGEIEAVLSSYEGVKQSVVIARDGKTVDGEGGTRKYLLGYFISEDALLESDIKEYMETKLPSYMIPNRLMGIDKIPVSESGKLDTKALPNMDFDIDGGNYCAPRNELEACLCEIWSDLLGVEKVGVMDDFFHMGGDSIRCLELVNRIGNVLNLYVLVTTIFKFKTIESLCRNVLMKNWSQKMLRLSDSCFTVEETLNDEVPLLPIQEWFFLKHHVSIHHWNQAFLIETPCLDVDKFKNCLAKLVEYHDAFKLRFKLGKDKRYIQYYDNSPNISKKMPFRCLDVGSLASDKNYDQLLEKVLTDWQSNFDLENGPLFSVGYLSGFIGDKWLIWFAMHHLIVDTVSWRIICEDLQRLYSGSSDLGRKGSSYGQWAQTVRSYGLHNSSTEGVYWRHLLNNVKCFNDSLSKHNVADENMLVMSTAAVTLSAVQTSGLLRDCPRGYDANINVLLLAALGYAVKELTGNRINFVTLEGHGREDIDEGNADISRTVGWFTTMYPVLLEMSDELMRTIMNIKVHLMQVPNKGIGYGTIIGYKDQDLPRVSFNYLGQFEAISSTKASASGKNRRWYITDGIVGVEQAETEDDDNIIDVNGFCMKGQMQFNIRSRLSTERTIQFANTFESKLTDIVRECPDTKQLNEMDYMTDFESPFTLLNADSDLILFILPPGHGGPESYFNNIVPQLSSFKLVVFNNYFHNLKLKNMVKGLSFEALARLYIKYIKLIQPIGPYNFFGWSFGGVLSFEISRQLNNAGDKIDNLVMIDSYFNLKKASLEIDDIHDVNIIDEINFSYLPDIAGEAFGLNIVNMNINIVLFKANKVVTADLSNQELKLFKYYTNAAFNCLDTLMNSKYIRLFEMHDQSHFSWTSSKEQIANICNYLGSVVTKRK